MAGRPRILVIDDLYGAAGTGRNRDRESFCFRAGIVDITGDVETEELKSPVAEGFFCSGQIVVDGRVENDLEGTLKLVRDGFSNTSRWSLVLLDLHFKTGRLTEGGAEGRDGDRDSSHYFGLEILREIRRDANLIDLPVIILSSMDRGEVEPIFSGLAALDFCDKSLLDRARMQRLLREHGLFEDDVIIGRSLPFLRCLREARIRAGHGNDNILIVGESGTGKELLANYLHRWSGRSGAYVPLFTQGVPDSLIEDRLFGHEKGAFAGAAAAMPGAAEQADKGTLFIDEFGEIGLSVQIKLLRLLDVNIRESQRLGSSRTKTLDLQVVLATNRFEALKGEKFRQDLLHRVKAEHPVILPPLRERRQDIPILAGYFLQKYESRFGAEPRTITEAAMEILMSHDWPGNVRALEEVIERAVLSYKGLRLLQPEHLGLGKPGLPLAEFDKKRQTGAVAKDRTAEPAMPVKVESLDLRDLLTTLAKFPYDSLPVSDLVASYSTAHDAMARCLAGLLRQALIATSRPTAANPSGEIYYTPAIHLLFGVSEQEKKKWPTSKCADRVRSIIGFSPALRDELLVDDVLRAAYDAATRLRQKK